MTTTTRDDFFTLIHKGLRRELFAVTTLSATMDWDDKVAVAEFAERWADLRHLLEIHAVHEDNYFLPLLDDGSTELRTRMSAEHEEQERALAKVSTTIDATVAAPAQCKGIVVHRELSAFVAGYLSHMLGEETLVMPAIWQQCTDEEISRARVSFIAAMSPDDSALSRRAMLPSVSPSERAGMLAMVRSATPRPVFEAVLDDARKTLPEGAWRRLANDLSLA